MAADFSLSCPQKCIIMHVLTHAEGLTIDVLIQSSLDIFPLFPIQIFYYHHSQGSSMRPCRLYRPSKLNVFEHTLGGGNWSCFRKCRRMFELTLKFLPQLGYGQRNAIIFDERNIWERICLERTSRSSVGILVNLKTAWAIETSGALCTDMSPSLVLVFM